MTLLIQGFPGVGKSFTTKYLKQKGYVISDSDSSLFDKSDFPKNYINHIKTLIKNDEHDIIFVSSHKEVREAIQESDLKSFLLYPSEECKDEYLRRYENRGSSETFIELLSQNFEDWVNEIDIEEHSNLTYVKLGCSQDAFLKEVIELLNRV